MCVCVSVYRCVVGWKREGERLGREGERYRFNEIDRAATERSASEGEEGAKEERVLGDPAPPKHRVQSC